ncbi:hypothetical protein O0L34_g17074 [Tuta absoluta]|nr:hypothetical protein O0L34_g17074 [Tuta absoluta]
MLLEKGGVSSWRCRNRKCKGFIKIDEVNKTILRARPHVESCKPDFALFQRQKILSVVKHFVANADPSIPIKKIYDNYVNAYLALNPNCENDLPKYDQIKDTLRRKRKHLIPPTVSGIKNVNVSYVEESPNLMFSDVSQKETDDREPDRDLPNYLGLPYGGTDHGKQEQAVPAHEGLKQETPDNVEKKNEGLLQGMLVHENQNPAVSGISRPDHENLKISVRAGLGFGGPHHGSLVRTGSGFRGPDHSTPNHAKADREIPVQEEPDIGP